MNLMHAAVFALCLATALTRSEHVAQKRAYRSRWANSLIQEERDNLIEGLAVGDLIECKSRKFGIEVYHWQIVTYVLEGDVYTHHVTGQNEAEMSVQEELFITIVHYYEKCRRNNGMDAYWTPKDAGQIAKCADCLAGEWKYDLLEQNCEHFVNFCRYGVFESMQVKERTLVAKMAARGSLIAIGASAVSVAAPSQASVVANAAYTSVARWIRDRFTPEVVDSFANFIHVAQATCLAA